MKEFNALKELVASLEADAVKFYEKGNSSAGTRLRIGMQNIKKAAQDIRVGVSEAKNAEAKPAPAKGVAKKVAPVAKKK